LSDSRTPDFAEERDKLRRRLSPKLVLGDEVTEKISNDGRLVAGGCGDGSVSVFSANTGEMVYKLLPLEHKALPVTCLRWRPDARVGSTRNMLLAVAADGTARHWHVPSSKCMSTTTEKGNQIFCVDYRSDGEKYATAGKDSKVRVYDEVTKTNEATLYGGSGDFTAGHSSRIFSLKNVPGNPFLMVTGGWDNTIQFWDTRVSHSVRSLYGPHVCGDSVDVHDNTLLTGSWRPREAIQLWDYTTGAQIQSMDWRSATGGGDPCLVYSAQFSHSGNWIAAGGSGANEARVIKKSNGQVLGEMYGFRKGIFSVDFAPDDSVLAVAGSATFQLFETRTLAENDILLPPPH
jgi:WD40 repeat protein